MQKQRKILITVTSALIVFAVGYAVYDIVINKSPVNERIYALAVLLGSLCLTLYRLCVGPKERKPLSFYEKAYSKHIDQAFTRDPKSRKQLLEALRYYNENNYPKAASMLQALKEQRPVLNDLKVVHLFLALVLTDYGLYDDAINEYKQLLAIDPRNSTALSNLGFLYEKIGNYDSAEECFSRAVDYDPDLASAHNNLGQLLFKKGDYESAIEECTTALELNGKFHPAASLLAVMYADMGQNDEYEKYYRIAVSNGGDPKGIHALIEMLSESDSSETDADTASE